MNTKVPPEELMGESEKLADSNARLARVIELLLDAQRVGTFNGGSYPDAWSDAAAQACDIADEHLFQALHMYRMALRAVNAPSKKSAT